MYKKRKKMLCVDLPFNNYFKWQWSKEIIKETGRDWHCIIKHDPTIFYL